MLFLKFRAELGQHPNYGVSMVDRVHKIFQNVLLKKNIKIYIKCILKNTKIILSSKINIKEG